MSELIVKIKMEEGGSDLMPRKAHFDDAGFDMRSRIDTVIQAGSVFCVPTGIHMELPYGYEAQVRPRSGLALKNGIGCLNSPGTIDAGYRGEVCAILFNFGKEDFHIKRGDRIAQMVIAKLPEAELVSVTELTDTDRGNGGFGSTGKK